MKRYSLNDMLGKGFDSARQESFLWQQYEVDPAYAWVADVYRIHGHAWDWEQHKRDEKGRFKSFPSGKGGAEAGVKDEFVFSERTLKRLNRAANFIDHVLEYLDKKKNNRDQQYASINDALNDFARRSGLLSIEAKTIYRQMLLKNAIDDFKVDQEKDLELTKSNPGLAGLGIGIDPNKTDYEKAKVRLKKCRKDMFDNDYWPLTDVDNPMIGDSGVMMTPDTGGIPVAKIYDQRTIKAQEWGEGDLFEKIVPSEEKSEESEELQIGKGLIPKLKKERRPGQKRGLPYQTRIRNLYKKINELETRLKDEFQDDKGKWIKLRTQDNKIDKTRLALRTKLRMELAEFKDELNYLLTEQKGIGARREIEEKRKQSEALFLNKFLEKEKELSDQVGIEEPDQQAFDETLNELKKQLYRDATQVTSKDGYEEVRCILCDYVNEADPSRLPISHLRQHERELLSYYTEKGIPEPEDYYDALVQAYLGRFPFASFESLEKQLSDVVRKAKPNAIVWTHAERDMERTDESMIRWIQRVFREYEMDKSLSQNKAREILNRIKENLEIPYAEIIGLNDEPIKQDFREEIGKLQGGEPGQIRKEPISIMDYQTAVADVMEDYISEFQYDDPYRKPWTTYAPKNKARLKRPTDEPGVDDLLEEVQKMKSEQSEEATEITKQDLDKARRRIKERSQQTTVSWKCWNDAVDNVEIVKATPREINSLSCKQCGAFKEVRVTSVQDMEMVEGQGKMKKAVVPWWKCPECGELKFHVIRDPRGGEEVGTVTYDCFCDENYNDGGTNASGTSVYVHINEMAMKEHEKGRLETEERDRKKREEEKLLEERQKATLQPGERINHEKLGPGEIVFTDDDFYYVIFDNKNLRSIKLGKELINQVVLDPDDNVYKKVKDMKTQSLPVMRKLPDGTSIPVRDETGRVKMRPPVWIITLIDPVGEEKQHYDKIPEPGQEPTITVATKISRQLGETFFTRASYVFNRKIRLAILRKLGKQGCTGHYSFTVERINKRGGTTEQLPDVSHLISHHYNNDNLRFTLLRNRLRRRSQLRGV